MFGIGRKFRLPTKSSPAKVGGKSGKVISNIGRNLVNLYPDAEIGHNLT